MKFWVFFFLSEIGLGAVVTVRGCGYCKWMNDEDLSTELITEQDWTNGEKSHLNDWEMPQAKWK